MRRLGMSVASGGLGLLLIGLAAPIGVWAQAQAPAPGAAPAAAQARAIGTVQSTTDKGLTLKQDKGDAVTVEIVPDARVVQLAPGSTDLKTAQPAAVSDIAVGDRVLVLGAAGDGTTAFAARRVILMKSAAISERRAADEADWQRRGTGGIVTAVDATAGGLSIKSGARTIAVTTTPKTIFRRYSDGSVKFEDAVKSTVAEVHLGDQIRVRGAKNEEGTSIAAEEVVSGTFAHVSGTLASVDLTAHRLTLKDLKTKKLVTVEISESTSIRTLPPEVAARVAARSKGGAAAGKAGGAGAHAGTETASTAPAAPSGGSGTAGGGTAGSGAGAGEREGGRERGDLTQIVAKLPETPAANLHKGDAVMIVGMPRSAADTVVAVTLLAGVEPILAANPNGEADSTLAPWNLGGAPEGGGAGGGGH